jgi:hypothetical protein
MLYVLQRVQTHCNPLIAPVIIELRVIWPYALRTVRTRVLELLFVLTALLSFVSGEFVASDFVTFCPDTKKVIRSSVVTCVACKSAASLMEPFLRSRHFCSYSRPAQNFKGPDGFIAVFTRAVHQPLSWATSIKTLLHRLISLRSILSLFHSPMHFF